MPDFGARPPAGSLDVPVQPARPVVDALQQLFGNYYVPVIGQ
ncbi:hypothetical protein [Streptomyces sp. NPDC059991]